MRILGPCWLLALCCTACAAGPSVASASAAQVLVSGKAVLAAGPCGTTARQDARCEALEEPAVGLVFSLVSSDLAGQPIRLTTGDDGTFSILLRPGRYTVTLETRTMDLEFAPTSVTVTPAGVRDMVLQVRALRPIIGPVPRV